MDGCEKAELYDLHTDPDEKRSLVGGDPDPALHQMFDGLTGLAFATLVHRDAIQQGDPPAAESLDEEAIEQLEALGYLK